MPTAHTTFLRAAFEAYMDERQAAHLEPAEDYLPYEFSEIGTARWSLLGAQLAGDEVCELTNLLNAWHSSLLRWHAWNRVIQTYDDKKAWELRGEFLEPLAHHCLLRPSAIRDTFTFVATNTMHQARLATDKSYADYLEGDPTPAESKPRHRTRAQKEERLARVVATWTEAPQFMHSLRAMNDKVYQRTTADYRNRTTHAIGPRLGIGITRAVTRSVGQATEFAQQPDGTFAEVPVKGKFAVSYGYGGTEPLDLEVARGASLGQFRLARECYTRFRVLLSEAVNAMPRA